jgi:hypothetical protein
MKLSREVGALLTGVSGLFLGLAATVVALAQTAPWTLGWPRSRSPAIDRWATLPEPERLLLQQRFREYVALNAQEKTRIEQLRRYLEGLPEAEHERLMTVARTYARWKQTLPLYLQERLEQASLRDFSDVVRQAYGENLRREQARPYWYLPPFAGRLVADILRSLPLEELNRLDQYPPFLRLGALSTWGRRGPEGFRGPRAPDPERLRQIIEQLPEADRRRALEAMETLREVFQQWEESRSRAPRARPGSREPDMGRRAPEGRDAPGPSAHQPASGATARHQASPFGG